MEQIGIPDQDLQDFILAVLQVNGNNPYQLEVRSGEVFVSQPGLQLMLKRAQACSKTYILPFNNAKEILWLVLNKDFRKLLQHAEELKSFLVPTLANTFKAGRTKFDPAKPGIGILGARLYSKGYYCFRSPLSITDEIFEALSIWAKLDEERPPIDDVENTSSAYRLRRQFQEALGRKQWVEAENVLNEIRQGHHLSDENSLFLKIQLLSLQERWAELWESDDYRLVAGLDHLPALVRRALLLTFYHCEIRKREEQGDLQAILEVIRQNSNKLGTLLSYRAGLEGDQFVRIFAYQATIRNQVSLLKELAKSAIDQNTREVIKNLLPLIQPSTTVSQQPNRNLEEGIAYFQQRRYDEAFLSVRACPPSVKRTQLLLGIAAMTEDKTISKVARQAFDSMNEMERQDILSDQYSKGWAKFILG